MKKFHIAFISSGVSRYLSEGVVKGAGGAERQQYLIGKELSSRGHKVTFITKNYEQKNNDTGDNYDTVGLIPSVSGYSGVPQKFLGIINAMRKVDADVYYVRGESFHFMLTIIGKEILGKPVVYCIAGDHHIDPELSKQRYGQIYRQIYNFALKRADEIVTLTRFQKKNLEDLLDLDATVIPVGYDLPDSQDLKSHKQRDSTFLWVGGITKKKEPIKFLEVASDLESVQFKMIAAPVQNPKLERIVKNKAKEITNVEFIGYIPPHKVHKYFREAKAFIQTTKSKSGIGNTTLEAWRFETPVISLYTDFDGKIEEKDLGLYSAGDIDKFKENILLLNDDIAIAKYYGQNGRSYLKENYLLNDTVNQYESLFNSMSI